MSQSTMVVNLATGAEYLYTLPPEEAVRIAYMQHALGDFNWWNIDESKLPKVVEGRYTYACGDYCARKETRW